MNHQRTPTDGERVSAEVEADLKRMEEALASSNPGIADMLKLYDNYEAAVRQANAYLQLLNPRPLYFTSDRSNR